MPTGIYLRKPFSEEHRQKISKTRKRLIAEGKIIVKNSYEKGHSSYNKGKNLSEEHKRKIKEAQSGKKCKLWRGGHKYYRVANSFWKHLREQVFKRDNYTCQRCKITGVNLACHHIAPYRISRNDSLDNLISVCSKCHAILDFEIIRNENIEFGL